MFFYVLFASEIVVGVVASYFRLAHGHTIQAQYDEHGCCVLIVVVTIAW